MGYLDDIIIFSKSEEEHLQHLEKIFKPLKHLDFKMKQEKSSFFKKHIQYLGYLISKNGFEPLPQKLKAIQKDATPKDVKRGQVVFGLNRVL